MGDHTIGGGATGPGTGIIYSSTMDPMGYVKFLEAFESWRLL